MTKCPHCTGTSWELQEVNVRGAEFRYYAIQCSNCAAPVATVEFENITAAIADLETKIDHVGNDVASVGRVVNYIASRMS